MKTRLYSDEREAAGTMISGTCLLCDYQGVPHRIFCDVTAGKRQTGRHDTEHLRYRLEGVLAVTLTLGPGMPDGLCLKCEKGLCEIESRVRMFRDMHHATREKYRQMQVAGDTFICDLTRLETRHSEGGSETRRETETRHETETYLPQTSRPAVTCQVWRGSDPPRGSRGDGKVCQEGGLTAQSALHTNGVQFTGPTTEMPVRPGPIPTEHRHSIGAAQYSDNSEQSQPTHSSISACTDSTTKAYGNMATIHRNSIGREVDDRTEVNGNMPTTRVSGHLNERHVDDSSRPAGHWNGIGGQLNGRIEHANSVLVNHRNGMSSEFKDIADDTYCRRLDTQCSFNGVNVRHDRQNGSQQALSEDDTYVNDCSVQEPSFAQRNGCYTDKLDKTCSCPLYHEQNHVKQTVNVGVESGPENRPSALNLSQTLVPEREDDTNGLVLDLTVARSLPERQHIEQQTRNVDDGMNNGGDEPWMLSEASKAVQSPADYPLGNGQGGEWEESFHQQKQVVNGTLQSAWVCSKAPPPLIHVSQIKKEPIENDQPFNKQHMSSLDYLQKIPFCIAPEGGKGLGQEHFYDDSFLGEPPHKRYKYGRGYSVPNPDASTSSFPVLNTHVSATLNVTHPGEGTNKNMAGEKTPAPNPNPSETVQTTTIQGTIRIPLNQLKNMKQGPANISLMTEATVNSTTVPGHQKESTHEQPQQSQHAAKIPVNMTINTDELRARIPLHQVFLDQVQPAMPTPGVHQSSTTSRRMLNAFETHGIPVHHLDSSGHPMTIPDSGNVSRLRKRLEPPDWKHVEWPVQSVQKGTPQSTTNPHLLQPRLEVTGHRGQGHRVRAQGHIAGEKPGFPRQMASYGWQHPRFSQAVVGHGQGQDQGQPMFPVSLQHPNMTPLQRHPHPSQPQGHSQSHQGQTEGQLHEGQTPRQDRKDSCLSQYQGQEQPDLGQADKGYTRQGQVSVGQTLHVANLQGQVHDREQEHHNGGLPVEDHADQNTTLKKTSRLDSAQTKAESEDEEDEEEDGKQVADQDVNTGNPSPRNDGSGRRQLLRPWLEQRLNRGNIPGFQWVDKDLNLFKIPWKHRSKNDWSPDNCTIFMEWALHTGKHRTGVDKPDYCRWKTRLRCAFNQAADIQERKDLNKMKCSEPYKVYEFLSKSEIKPKPLPKPKPQVDVSKMPTTTTTIHPPGVPGMVPHPASSPRTLTGSIPHHVSTYQKPNTMEIYTAVTGALMAVGGPLIHHDQGSPSSSASDQQQSPPPATSSEQKSPNATKMAAEPFPAEPVSIPIETNNNKFSWAADLDDERPLVIDLDRTDNGDDKDNMEGGKNELLHTDNRQNRQTQDGQFSYIHKHHNVICADNVLLC